MGQITEPQARLFTSIPEENFYPSSDGAPMAETDTHVDQILLLKASLEMYYRERQDVSVSANIFLYYQEGDSTRCVSPDVMVTLGVPRGKRKSFFVWKEGKSPDVVFEITSDSSFWYDMGEKLYLYQKMGVRECFVFNPLSEPLTLAKALGGYRFVEDRYRLIIQDQETVVSEVLQLEMAIHEGVLRLRNPKTKQWIPTLVEETEARELAEQKAQVAEQKAQVAEQKAQVAEQKAQVAEQKVAEEAKARELAEQRIRELEKKLQALEK